MGSILLDNGESVYIHDGTGSADPVAISAAEGSSVANLMKNRERFDYTWADTAERAAQTGMIQGSRGYQEDTKTEYIYDNSAWRLATPYIEFSSTGNNVTPLGTYVAISNWSVDAGRSTDTSFVTVSGNGFTFLRSGVYSISMTGGFTATAAPTFLAITTDSPVTVNPISLAPTVANVGTMNTIYRTSADNIILYVWASNNTASSIAGLAMRIIRLG